MSERMQLIWGRLKADYFSRGIWTEVMVLKGRRKLAFRRNMISARSSPHPSSCHRSLARQLHRLFGHGARCLLPQTMTRRMTSNPEARYAPQNYFLPPPHGQGRCGRPLAYSDARAVTKKREIVDRLRPAPAGVAADEAPGAALVPAELRDLMDSIRSPPACNCPLAINRRH